MASVPDFAAFTAEEKTALLTAVKGEILRRASGGAVNTGSSSSQAFSVLKFSDEMLTLYLNGLTQELGFAQPMLQVRPNFSGIPGYWPGC